MLATSVKKDQKELNPYKRVRPVDKAGKQPCYELVFLLRSDMSHEDARSIVEKVGQRLKESGGSVKNRFYWGLRSLRYKIKRMRRAHFYCIHFTAPEGTWSDMERFLRNNPSILRFINIRMQFFPKEKAAILVNLEQDIADGAVVLDEKYSVSGSN